MRSPLGRARSEISHPLHHIPHFKELPIHPNDQCGTTVAPPIPSFNPSTSPSLQPFMAVGETRPGTVCDVCLTSQSSLPGTPLKRCGGCKQVLYCSRKCQESAWPAHKTLCKAIKAVTLAAEQSMPDFAALQISNASPGAPPLFTPDPSFNRASLERFGALLARAKRAGIGLPAFPLSTPSASGPLPTPTAPVLLPTMQGIRTTMVAEEEYIHNATHMITSSPNSELAKAYRLLSPPHPPNAYLSSFIEIEAMKQLINAFRLRMEDNYIFNFVNEGVYAREDATPLFEAFVDMADEKGFMPEWWNEDERDKMEYLAQQQEYTMWLGNAVDRADVIKDHGGEFVMPLLLRKLADNIYGDPVIKS